MRCKLVGTIPASRDHFRAFLVKRVVRGSLRPIANVKSQTYVRVFFYDFLCFPKQNLQNFGKTTMGLEKLPPSLPQFSLDRFPPHREDQMTGPSGLLLGGYPSIGGGLAPSSGLPGVGPQILARPPHHCLKFRELICKGRRE